MNPLRSVGARLSLALLLVVAGALGIVYLVVVPSLEDRLVNTRLDQLSSAAPGLVRQLFQSQFDADAVRTAAESSNARIVLFSLLGRDALNVERDSSGNVNSSDVTADPLALEASRTLRTMRGTVTRHGQRFAEVVVPAADGSGVLLISASLRSSLADVHLVKQRLLFAGLLALLVSVAVGYGAAWMFARRIRRLEQAADRIAAGHFDQAIVDESRDELGELARGFDRMRQRLAQLDDARRAFIANASHELRTPLFSLGGFLELLTDEELDDETRTEFLISMREQVDRLTRLATDLLDLSRLDAGRLRVEQEAVDLAAVARTVVDEFRAVAIAGEHVLLLEDEAAPIASADGQRVLQIARILVENGLRHTPEGTTVSVRTVGDTNRAVLEIEDDGPGVPPDQADRLFERFYRVEGARASGSGLGLAIARELAHAMEGSVDIESRPRRTVFRLSLPLERSDREDVPSAERRMVPA